MSKIYTGGGDRGMTSLVGGFRVSKTHPRLEAYGTIDELNSFIGLLITETNNDTTRENLLFIQNKLFSVGSYLATDPTKTEYRIESRIDAESIRRLEQAIDLIDRRLPKMTAFVLPGGCRSAALAHVCRTVCRRAERHIYTLAATESVEESVTVFINRLSDFLFVTARDECLSQKGEEIFRNNSDI
ncbi:MAG: cob(I)yrinic acid a,c-diamide adenosyltransferase [Tannerella sp.]|jgi:cob(I)alamin adenosyltransferase|nr:cob(I)yrinic acid a,c-diamide adenosyltransferase [Tannerella sp.]